MKLYLLKLGEISLKGGNRHTFEKILRDNIREKLREYETRIDYQKGRFFLHVSDDADEGKIIKALETTFGLVGFARAYECDKEEEKLWALIDEMLGKTEFSNKGTFKIDARREDKSFPLRSYDIAVKAAEIVARHFPSISVDLKNPDYTLHIEVRQKIYVYSEGYKAPGGLPVGSAGKGLLLLSGGIDSPVAAYLAAKRGLRLDFLYFHAYPYTSDEALEKVKKLASLVAPYTGHARLFVVPFTDGQLRIKEKAYEDETTLMFRASMMILANKIAKKTGAKALVTGESLSQVASQTLSAMAFTDSMSEMLVIRPLVTYDKEEIISLARKIGTYETSILPYEDCCVIFSPKHPLTNPEKDVMEEHFNKLEMEEEIDKAIGNIRSFRYGPNGEETSD